MRRAAALMTGLILLISMAGCATSPAERHSYKGIKCPACGYEFDSPRE